MKEIKLLPHNEIAYDKLKKFLLHEQKGSINHATGTGKSFIILKYLYKRRNKKILYLAPTYSILDQLTKDHMEDLDISIKDFENFETMIYRNLLSADIKELASKYDIIVFDEYHRCGAEKWGEKVRELLRYVELNYPNTKIIGTTATEIRYLDGNKDMNKILFDGKEISKLTLTDAILDGILPAPLYVSFDYNLIYDLIKIEKNINKYAFYEDDRINYLRKIQRIKDEIDKALGNTGILQNYIKDCKKFLVFSSTIKKINENKQIVEKLLNNIDNTYIVHSEKSRSKNLDIIQQFRKISKDDLSVLYSVDMLNEGVHVKGVDAIFMMRYTTSPIIYFQQLGRLLSYSRRKDQVVVLDFVNNIKNSPIIYELYEDVCKKAKERIISDPYKKEHYEEIIKRFKIIDETSKIYDQIEKLKKEFSKDSIIENRLRTAIKILKNEIDFNKAELIQAQLDILKYENYITIEMYDNIKELSLLKNPSIMNFEREEFVNYLNGNKNIHEKNHANIKDIYKLIIDFYNENHRIPHIFSNDKNESNISRLCINNYSRFSKIMKDFIAGNIDDKVSNFEILCYGLYEYNEIDANKLEKEIYKAINLGCEISSNVYLKLINEFSQEEVDKISIFQYNVLKKEYHNVDSNVNKEILFRQDFEKYTYEISKELRNSNIDLYIENLYLEINNYIINNKKDLEYFPKGVEDIDLERKLYCKKIIFYRELQERGYIDKINKIVLDVKTNSYYYMIHQGLEQLLKFMKEHQGAKPSLKNSDPSEISLAVFYERYQDVFKEEEKKAIAKINEQYINQKSLVLNKYISFIKTKRRKPMSKYSDEYEKNLIENFNRWYPYYNEDELKILNDVISSIGAKESIRNVYLEYKKRKK